MPAGIDQYNEHAGQEMVSIDGEYEGNQKQDGKYS